MGTRKLKHVLILTTTVENKKTMTYTLSAVIESYDFWAPSFTRGISCEHVFLNGFLYFHITDFAYGDAVTHLVLLSVFIGECVIDLWSIPMRTTHVIKQFNSYQSIPTTVQLYYQTRFQMNWESKIRKHYVPHKSVHTSCKAIYLHYIRNVLVRGWLLYLT